MIFRKPKDIPNFPVVNSFWRAIRYHLGSLAFGSLILAIVQFIKAMLEYLDQKAKASQNIIAEFLVKCLKCCFWCLEQFIKFLNKNAYIMVGLFWVQCQHFSVTIIQFSGIWIKFEDIQFAIWEILIRNNQYIFTYTCGCVVMRNEEETIGHGFEFHQVHLLMTINSIFIWYWWNVIFSIRVS